MTSDTELLQALPIAVYTTDPEGRITFFNDAAADLWGFRPDLGQLWCGTYKLYDRDGAPLPHDQCPMAQALREGQPVRGVRAVIERPDGRRVPFMSYPTPLYRDGELVGGINMLVDFTDHAQGEIDSARLAAIVSSSDDAIISKTLQGRITSWNAGAALMFGYEAAEIIGESILKLVPPELQNEEKDIIARLSHGERLDHFETVRLAKDGRRVDISLTVSPIRDATGVIVGASKVARDVSDRKRAEEVQRLLIDELNHRIKNTLATVQAIATQTLRHTASPDAFVASFTGRIHALARAHALLTGSSFQGADVLQLVRDQLMLGGEQDNRIDCAGPSIILDAHVALHLALVLHELGTNARKHGALSTSAGTVEVGWELVTNDGRTLVMTWRENGGPPVTAPTTRGFGALLIEQSLQAHGGDVATAYSESGFSCRINLPLSDLEFPLAPFAYAAEPNPRQGASQQVGISGATILIVEDEPLIGMVLADCLLEAGCNVLGPAQSVQKAKDMIARESFDAALVDGNLAGRPEDEIAAALAQKQTPFVFVTGYGREALPIGFQDSPIVEKPFTPRQVIAALERLLSAGGDNVVPLKTPRRAPIS